MNLGEVSVVPNRNKLREELGARESGGFYICTIQKFCDREDDKIGPINEKCKALAKKIKGSADSIRVCEGARDFFVGLCKKASALLTQSKDFWCNITEKYPLHRALVIYSVFP